MRHETPIIEYITASFLMHLAATLLLLCSPVLVNTTQLEGTKIEVNIVERPKSRGTVIVPPSPSKSLIPRRGKKVIPKDNKGDTKSAQGEAGGDPIELKDYADHLKAAVDPVWYVKVRPILNTLDRVYTTNVLLFPDKYGNIVSVKVIGPSGRKDLDQIALDTFRSIGKIPKPPEVLVKEGIIWDFTVSEKM